MVECVVDHQEDFFSGNILRLDSQGNEYVFVAGIQTSPKYWTNKAGSWESTLLPMDDYYRDFNPIIDNQDHIHVIYSAEGLLGKTIVRHLSNQTGQWQVETLNIGSYNMEDYKVAIDADRHFHFIYWTYYFGLYHSTNESGQWVHYKIDDEGSTEISLELDDDGHCHISYSAEVDDGTGSTASILKYATNADSVWVEQIVDSDLHSSYRNNIRLGPGDEIGICYIHSLNYYLQLAYFNGGDWITTDITDQSSTAYYCRYLFDINDQTHIVFSGYDNGVNHAYGTPENLVVKPIDTAGDVRGGSFHFDGEGWMHLFYQAETGFYKGEFPPNGLN